MIRREDFRVAENEKTHGGALSGETKTTETWNIIQVAPARFELSHAKQPATKERDAWIRLHLALAAYLSSSRYLHNFTSFRINGQSLKISFTIQTTQNQKYLFGTTQILRNTIFLYFFRCVIFNFVAILFSYSLKQKRNALNDPF